MLNNPTVEKLKDLKLKVMADMLSEPNRELMELTFEERLGIMVEKEWLSRKNCKRWNTYRTPKKSAPLKSWS